MNVKKLRQPNKGITLIALVVTIVILLILAGITINLVFSDNGIIKKAQEATNKTQETVENEQAQINDLTSELMEILGENSRATDIYVFLYDDGTLTFGTQNEQIEGKNVVKEYGNIKGQEYTVWLDKDNNRVNNTPWFNEVSSITKVNIVDEIVPTSMSVWFDCCINLTEIENIERLNTSEVESFYNTFGYCSSLTDLDLSSFDTINVTNMEGMFGYCSNLNSLKLSSNFTTNNVTNMGTMFYGCNNLTNLDLSSFNTNNVTTMASMFKGCSSLASLNLGSNFNTSNVITMSHMFYNCSSLANLDLRSFKTNNVASTECMFFGCSSLANIDLGSNFYTNNVTSMSHMFYNCSSLTNLDLSSFSTSKVKDMTAMFYGCTNLTTIYVGDNWNITNVENTNSMFDYCGTTTTTPK